MAKKRLIYCTYPSVYSSLVLKSLLADHDIEVVAIIASSRVLNKKYGAIRAALKQIQLSGWRYSTYLFFITDLFALLSAILPGRNRLLSVAKIARNHKIPLMQTADINEAEALDFIASCQADVLLAAHFNQLIKPVILSIPGLSCLNMHPSRLPDYKGVDPVFFALLDKQQQIGVTLHQMAERFDSGNIVMQQSFSSTPYNNLFSHNCRLFSAGATQVSKAIAQLSMHQGKPQNQEQGRYDSWPDASQVKKLRIHGLRLLDLPEYWKQIRGKVKT